MNIKPYEKNAKKHPKKQIEQVANSIKEFGMNQQIVVDKQGVIIVGHGRYEALKSLGMEVKPEYIKVVDLTEQQAKAYRLADNKLNESEWDMNLAIEELKGLSDEMFDLTGFDKDLIIEADEKDDEVPETPEEPKSVLGDLYELGQHRVLCGDSLKMDDVVKLMGGYLADIVVTNPPYNTGMQGKNNTNEKENWEQFIKDFLSNYIAFTKGQCAFYVFIDRRRVNYIRSEMEKLMDVKNAIVWDKKVHGLGSDYKSTYKTDDIVMDLFLGSGSTIIASEELQRKCFGMELMPQYVDVCVQRYVDFTSNENIKLNGKDIIWKKTQK